MGLGALGGFQVEKKNIDGWVWDGEMHLDKDLHFQHVDHKGRWGHKRDWHYQFKSPLSLAISPVPAATPGKQFSASS
jgi:hypothetical protein